MRRWLKWAAIGVGAVLTLSAVLIIGGLVALRTKAGADWVSATAAKSASSPDQSVSISGVSGILPFDIHITRIAVADRDGVWLTINDTVLDIDPWALLHGTARVEMLSARQIDALRAPVPPTQPKPVSSGSFSLPNLPVAVELDRLSVERIELAPPVAGQAVVMAITGSADLAGGAGAARIDLKRLDGPGSLTLDASYGKLPGIVGNGLDLQLHALEPSGVVLANLAADHQPRPLKLDLAGKGPLADWHGRLDLTTGSDGTIGADLALKRLVAAYGFAVTGNAAIAALLPQEWQEAAGHAVSFDTAITLPDAGSIDLEHLKVAAGVGVVAASGNYDPISGDLSADATVSADLAPLAGILGGDARGRLDLTAKASGSVKQPTAKLTLTGQDLTMAGTSIAATSLAVDISPAPGGDIAFAGTARIDGLIATGVSAEAGLGDRIDIGFDARATEDRKRISINRLTVDGAGLKVAANGKMDDGKLAAHAELDADDLSKFKALAGLALGGGVSLKVDASSADGAAADVTLAGSFHNLRTGIPAAEAALGPNGTLALGLQRDRAGTLTLKDLKLVAANVSASGGGSYDPTKSLATGDIRVSVPQLRPIGQAVGTPMTGALTLTATGSGNQADLKLVGTDMAIGAARIDRLDTDIAIPDLAAKAATITAAVTRAGTAAHLDIQLAQLDRNTVVVKNLKLTGPATDVTGRFQLDTTRRVVDGKLDAKIADLAAWAPIVGQRLSGRLSATASFNASQGAGPNQDATIALSADDLAAGTGKDAVRLKGAKLNAQLTDLMGKPGGHATLALTDAAASDLLIQSLRLDAASQKGGAFGFGLSTNGNAATKPIALTAKGQIAIDASGQKLTLGQLDAKFGDLGGHLEHSLGLEHRGSAVKVTDLAVAVANGHVSGNAAYDGRTVSASLHAVSLAIGTFTKIAGRGEASGALSLDAAIDGPVAGPQGKATLQVRNLAFAPSAGQPSLPIDLTLSALLAPQSVTMKGRVTAPKGDVALDLAGMVPVAFVPGGGVSVQPNGALQARITGGGRLEPLNDLAPIGEDRMGGSYAIDLSVSGTPAAPEAGGSLSISDGSYTNDASGMTLRHLGVRITGQGRQFTLAELSASDGGSGKLSATGKVDLGQASGPTFDLSAKLSSFTGARSDEITAVLSGTASVTGSLAAPHVVSDLSIDRAEVNIPEQLPASYAKLDVIRINSLHPLPPAAEPPPPVTPIVATLDVKVHDANQTFVRGDGLDSEWKGDLAVAGTSAAPKVTGELQSISGTFAILGKDFTLQRGVVDFLGSPTPVFDIQAQAQAADVTAVVELQGTPDQPKLTLTSTPALPQDEVLSRIMFGSGTSQLTPVQGLQIAAAAASLAGGGGPGVLDRLRNFTGLDRLSLGSDNTNGSSATQGSGVGSGTSISGGKYVAPGVYVGVAQGISGSSTRATVQVNVTPHVTVNATVGAGDNSGSSLGAQYQLDY